MALNVELRRCNGTNFGERINVSTDWQLIDNKPVVFPPTTHTHNVLIAIDDRDVKPSDLPLSTKQVKAYFTSLGGLNGVADSDYQDLLVMDTYSDASGGKVNALAFDKSEMRIKHFQADYGGSFWGVPKTIAYLEDLPSGGGGNPGWTTLASVNGNDGMASVDFNEGQYSLLCLEFSTGEVMSKNEVLLLPIPTDRLIDAFTLPNYEMSNCVLYSTGFDAMWEPRPNSRLKIMAM